MPLLPGRENIGRNITELREHGSRPRSERQILAIALSEADRHPRRAFGGGIGHIEGGGIGAVHMPHIAVHKPQQISPSQGAPWWTRSAAREMTTGSTGGHPHFEVGGEPMSMASPWWERQDARQIEDIPHGGGLINSAGAGRTDRLPLVVGSDSHVMPADTVSGLGQGNSLAGARILQAALRTGPWGTALPHEARGHGPPAPPHLSATAPGGGSQVTGAADGGRQGTTSILAAGGEVVVPPEDVEALGRRGIAQGLNKRDESAMDLGHRLLDELIHRVRKFNIDWLKHAPPPKK